MPDVLTWTMDRRMLLAERAELLRKELAEIEVEVARLEAAEIVYGQWAEATDGGRRDVQAPDPVVEPAGPARVETASGAGGMLLVPHRGDGVSEDDLPEDYRRILQVVAGAEDQPVMTRQVCEALGMDIRPQQTEPMRGKLKRLADRGWLHRTPSGRYGPL
ncbi:hypothetical protein ACIRQP_42405 [Streptomyces sp. NPDC102274]|uniref:hypothetical protein n=1 Tax=Streptomyces sp. NPDC102274 TaxID=3366151 RepID=UPI00380C3A3A